MGYSYTFKEREVNFADETRINYSDFLLSEFFNASNDEKEKILNAYKSRFGISSYNYMLSNYWYSWQRGNRNISNVQTDRICSIMPQLLNEAAIHKLGVNDFMMGIKDTVKAFLIAQKAKFCSTVILKNPQELTQFFEKEFEKIKGTTIRSFRFNVLKDKEKQEALEIVHYILETKLQKSFDQIERDFNVFLPYMFSFNRGIFSASYLITNYNLKVDITKTGLNDIIIPKLKIREIKPNSNFISYADKYLAYELLNLHAQSQVAVSNSFLNANEIELFFDRYEELSFGDSEVNMKFTFQGEGGTLTIQVQFKPLKMIKTSMYVSITKLIAYSIILIGLVTVAINSELFPLLIFGGLFVGGIFYTLISEEIKQLKVLKIQIKQYGQQ
jgi:hypothetical protein